MTGAEVLDVGRDALWLTIQLCAPVLLVGLVVGVVIGLFQALTSVQEMTLTFVPKVGLMLVVFWVTMSFMTTLLSGFFTDQILPLIAGQVADRSGDMHLAFFVPLAGYLLLTAFALVCSRWRGAEGQAAPVASPH